MKERLLCLLAFIVSSMGCTAPHSAQAPRASISNNFDEAHLNTPIKVLLARGLSAAEFRALNGELYLFDEKGRGWNAPNRRISVTLPKELQPTQFLVNGKEIASRTLFIRGRYPSDRVTFQGEVFKGTLKLSVVNSRLRVINLISLEQYLVGVVSSEMSGSWELEALKAQVVAARSYALFMMKHPRDSEYTLERTTSDQVYNGSLDEPQRVRQAVAETTGQFLSKSGQPIKAFYHSRCGGSTENAAEVWAKNGKPVSATGPRVDCPGCRRNPYRWSASIHTRDLVQALDWPHSPQRSLRLAAVDRSTSGRLSALRIESGSLSRRLSGDELRALLGYSKVKSTQLSVQLDKNQLTLQGIGAGHGVGMCQWGARYLAKAGKDYLSILRHYYPGVELAGR